MPTGYTASIKDGITFETFIMRCAKAFGALITMRDDPSDTPIPDEFKPSDYHSKEIGKLRAELGKNKAMSIRDAALEAKKEYDKQIAYNENAIKECNELCQKYKGMQSKVQNWHPPTPNHIRLKDFMLEQISQSIDFDCDTDHYKKQVELLTGEQWLSKKNHSLLKDIDYHTRKHQEEIERVMERNEWVKQLRDSIGL